ncbi:MAG: hypothetical protein ACOX2O_00365 [Bdellovibrionota bacterium]|jgi:hypothetical protein
MESETFQIRVSKLIQKCRKAVRLYSSVGRLAGVKQNEFSELQVAEWKDVNILLLQGLTSIMEVPGRKGLSADLFALRDRFYMLWRAAESDMHMQHKDLLAVVEGSDFIKAAKLSSQLISLKARVQATQAAHHELQDLLDKSHLVPPAIELSKEAILSESVEEDTTSLAKVIPLRRRCI